MESDWTTHREVKDRSENIITEKEKIIERWREYFEELLINHNKLENNHVETKDNHIRSRTDIEKAERWDRVDVEVLTFLGKKGMKNYEIF